jgi:L-histidine N-alpha-methyltransferase
MTAWAERRRARLATAPHFPDRRRTGVAVAADLAEAMRELRAALHRSPREIPCKYLYDDRGSALFEQIMGLPEYYPTRTERALLIERAAEIAAAGGPQGFSDFVELGSGAASKTVALLEAAIARGRTPRYVAVDISAHALERTRQILVERFPGLPVLGLMADYERELQLPARAGGGSRLALFLGGTIGNEEDDRAVQLLSRVRAHFDDGDALLLGANLVTDAAVIEAAYNDSQGVTAAFNRNILSALNRLAGSDFDPAAFEHRAPYVRAKRRIEMWLHAKRDLRVDLGRMGGALDLREGEGILTEISRRFTRRDLERLLGAAGFEPERWMESPDGRFGLALARADGFR